MSHHLSPSLTFPQLSHLSQKPSHLYFLNCFSSCLSSCHSLHLPLPPVSLSHSSQISPFMFNPQPLSVSFVPLHLISSCPLFRILFASRVFSSHPVSLNGPQGFWEPWGGGQPVDLKAGKGCGASRHLRRVGMDGPEVGRAC